MCWSIYVYCDNMHGEKLKIDDIHSTNVDVD